MRVDVAELLRGAGRGLAVVGGDPLDLDPGLVGETAGAQRLGDREVGVGQVDVLADQRDGDLVVGVVDAVQQVVPGRPVHVAERQVQLADDVGVQALGVQHLRDVVDRLGGQRPLRLRVQLRSFDAVCRLVECKVGIGIVPETTAHRVAKTMAIAVVPLTDSWAVRELTICIRGMDDLPLYARQLVEHLRAQ